MKFSTFDLETNRQWRAATGVDQSRFAKLLLLIPTAYEQMFGLSIQQRQAECPEKPALNTYENLLLFTLFSLKSTLFYDLLGLTTGMDGSTAKRNQTLGVASHRSCFARLWSWPQTVLRGRGRF